MSIKADKLARELLALRSKYSERDFEDALTLIESGKYWEPMSTAVRKIRSIRPSATLSPISDQKPRSVKNVDQDLIVERIISRASTDPKMRDFIKDIISRDVLFPTAKIHAFTNIIGLTLPKKIPSRVYLADKVMNKMAEIPSPERDKLIEFAYNLAQPASSLQLWSDVIIRTSQED